LLFATTAITGLSILAMTVVGMLVSAEQHSAEALWIDSRIASLGDTLRTDAHLALRVEPGDPSGNRMQTLTLVHPHDVRISYECTDEGVVRRESNLDGHVSTETFRLPFGESWFEPLREERLVEFVHARAIPTIGGFSSADREAVQRNWRLIAMVGLHDSGEGEVE
jgi:hypothetical protein